MIDLAGFRKLIGPIQRSVRMMVSRALLTLIDDAQATQEINIQVLFGEELAGVERFQNYGCTSVPFPGAEAILVSVAGNRTQGVVIVVNDKRWRPTDLQPGEGGLHDDQEQTILIRRDGIVATTTKQVTVNAPKTIFNGEIEVNGGITTTKDVVAGKISLQNHLSTEVQHGNDTSGKPQ